MKIFNRKNHVYKDVCLFDKYLIYYLILNSYITINILNILFRLNRNSS